MVDNTTLNPGSGGDVIASDDIAGVKYQRIKSGFGVDGSYVDVSATDPLPVTGPLTNTQFTTVAATKLTGTPDASLAANPVRIVGQEVWNANFTSAGSSVLSPNLTTPIVGTGVTYNQTSSQLNILTGTTTNAEFLTRSTVAWRSTLRHRLGIIASQRIANQNLAVMLGDLIGEGLACTINSATSITVTKVAHGFTSTSVGQFMMVGGIVGAAGVPGRYAIASIPSVDTITFTVAGWPASGTCTLTLFGHSYIRLLFNSTTATTQIWGTQYKGYTTGDVAISTLTTASPGLMLGSENDGRTAYCTYTGRQTTPSPAVNSVASAYELIPDNDTDLYMWVWNYNGTVAPASTTTWSITLLNVERFSTNPVYVQGFRNRGLIDALQTTTFLSGGTVTTVSAVTAVATVSTVTTVGSVTSSNKGIPGIITDVASAALTATTTTATIVPTFGTSYSISVPVTLVSGTTPTLDIGVEESDDTGTNWVRVYDFPRITATGFYRSPVIPLTGNRVRYVQTVTGTTPSFTRAINRLQSSRDAAPLRQLIDRTIVLTTLNSTTSTLDTRDCGNRAQVVVNIGAVTTTAPALQMEGSDDNGLTWYAIGAPLTAVASSTVQLTVVDLHASAMRVRVSTAGVGVTAGYVLLKAHD